MRFIQISSSAVFVITFVAYIFIRYFLSNNGLHIQDTDTGHIYRLETHGDVRYITSSEINILIILIFAAIIAFIVGFVSSFRLK